MTGSTKAFLSHAHSVPFWATLCVVEYEAQQQQVLRKEQMFPDSPQVIAPLEPWAGYLPQYLLYCRVDFVHVEYQYSLEWLGDVCDSCKVLHGQLTHSMTSAVRLADL